MRKLFLLSLIIISCSTQPKELLNNFETDFPKADTLPYEVVNKFELYSHPWNYIIKDSLFFALEHTVDNFGRCFNINSGQEVAKVVNRGNANYEMKGADHFILFKDSIGVISINTPRSIKLFSIDDMINGTTPNPRTITLPDTIHSSCFDLSDHHTIVGITSVNTNAPESKYFLLNKDGYSSIGEINRGRYTSNQELKSDQIRRYSMLFFSHYIDKMVTVSNKGLHIEIVDLSKKEILSGRYYDKIEIKIEERGNGILMIQSNSAYRAMTVACNKDNIFVVGSASTSSEETIENFILIFDWEMKPVKKYILKRLGSAAYISEDCQYIYTILQHDDMSALYRYKL